MSKAPRIVAELGRPETPDETAARKAAATAAHRRNQTFTNLILSLLASVVVVIAIVVFVPRFEQEPPPAPNVPQLATEASASVDSDLLAPALPDTWTPNVAELRGSTADIVSWYVGYVTPGTQFVSLTQGINADGTWLENTIREAAPTGEMTIDGVEWLVYDQRGQDVGNLEYVMTTVTADSTIVLAGTAENTEFMQFAESVSAELAE